MCQGDKISRVKDEESDQTSKVWDSLSTLCRILATNGLYRLSRDRGQGHALVEKRAKRSLINVWSRRENQGLNFRNMLQAG